MTETAGAVDSLRALGASEATEPSRTRLSAPGGSGQSSRTRAAENRQERPSMGPGSPVVASKPVARHESLEDLESRESLERLERLDNLGDSGANVTPITQRGRGRRPRLDKRAAARANARGGQRGAAEARIRAALARDPELAFDALVKVAGVSPSSASKWLAVIETERGVAQHAR